MKKPNNPGYSWLPCIIAALLLAQCRAPERKPADNTGTVHYRAHGVSSFFPKKNLMSIGVFYYPEQWPRSQWERDLNNIAGYGFEFTHFAEFSWALLEPSEGRYDFAWLDDAIDLASKAGLKVILCTPSLCPPAWMGEKYPDIYLVGPEGRRREHGNRANASITNPRYRAFVERIVEEMGKHYAHDKRIWGWQLDNEPLAIPDYSPSARQAFQKWLAKKYGNIERQNAAWAGSFWSTRYDNFDQVLIPNEALAEEDKLSPHALLDFRRFTADATADFLNRQADILRRYISPDQWITTNYVNVSTGADPRLSDHLDFPCFTMYPVSGRNELGGNNFRTGVPYKIYEACDYNRPISGVTGMMELQPGQVNWASINPQTQPGVVHMWIIQAFGGGCSFLCTYRYRHPIRGSEMYHEGIVGNDGVTLTEGGKQFVEAIQELKQFRTLFNPTSVLPDKLAKRKTGLLWSHEAMWDLDIQKQTSQWDTWKNRNHYSAAIKSTGAPLDFISEQDDFSAYPFIIAPAYQLVDSVLIARWKKYAENGGNLILGCRSGVKNRSGHFFESAWAGPIRELIGADLDFFDMLIPGTYGHVKAGGKEFSWSIWADILTPDDGTEVLATFADQYYAGKPAAVTRKLGKGTVTYIGVASDDGTFERHMIRSVYERAGVAIDNFPAGIFQEWRDGFYVGVNYTDTPYKFTLDAGSRVLTGSNPLPPAQALVWKTGD